MKTEPVHLHLPGGDYVLIPRAEYLRLCEGRVPDGVPLAEAKIMVMKEIGRSVRLARVHARLTQVSLAKRLKVTQAMVSRAESGTARVSSAYIGRVLKACKLPADWVPPETEG